MAILHRFVCAARALFTRSRWSPTAAAPELWCRAATILALRNRAHAADSVAGWR